MKIASPMILLVCGVIALVGVFLPWVDFSLYWMDDGISISGWEAFNESGLDGATAPPFLVFIGSILLLVFALTAIIVSANPEGSQKVVLSLYILASIGAALGIGGASWLTYYEPNGVIVGFPSYGFYISYAAAALGLIFGIISIINSQRAGFQITLVVKKLSIGLVLFLIGILTIFLTIRISEGSGMEDLGLFILIGFIGGLLAIAGLILLVTNIISWLKKRRY